MAFLKHNMHFNAVNFARWLAIVLLISLLFSPPLSNLFEISLFAAFLSVKSLRARFIKALNQPAVVAALIFYLMIIVSTAYSVATSAESFSVVWGWRKILLLPIAVALFDDIIWKRKLALIFIGVSTLCAMASFIFGFLEMPLYKYAVGIVIRNHATQGIIFSVAAFTAALFLLSQRTLFNRNQQFALLLSCLLLVVNIAYITPGRSGYLALIVLSLVFVGLYAYLQKKWIVPALILLALPVLLLSSANVQQRIKQGVAEATNYENKAEATSMGMRMSLWKNTLELIKEKPLLGYGTGGFEHAYKLKMANSPSWEQVIVHDPHNQFLKIMAEHGTVGLIVFLGLIVAFFLQKPSLIYYGIGIGVLLVWCGNSLFSSHFSTFTEGRFLFLWCGVMLANETLKAQKSE